MPFSCSRWASRGSVNHSSNRLPDCRRFGTGFEEIGTLGTVASITLPRSRLLARIEVRNQVSHPLRIDSGRSSKSHRHLFPSLNTSRLVVTTGRKFLWLSGRNRFSLFDVLIEQPMLAASMMKEMWMRFMMMVIPKGYETAAADAALARRRWPR